MPIRTKLYPKSHSNFGSVARMAKQRMTNLQVGDAVVDAITTRLADAGESPCIV